MNKPRSRRAPSPDAPMGSITPYGLRMPRELKEALEAAAHENGRSLNSEIVARLDASVRGAAASTGLSFVKAAKSTSGKTTPSGLDLEARVSDLEKAVKALQEERS